MLTEKSQERNCDRVVYSRDIYHIIPFRAVFRRFAPLGIPLFSMRTQKNDIYRTQVIITCFKYFKVFSKYLQIISSSQALNLFKIYSKF